MLTLAYTSAIVSVVMSYRQPPSSFRIVGRSSALSNRLRNQLAERMTAFFKYQA